MNEIYQAIYTKLDTDITTAIFDHVPQDNYSFPYIRLDPIPLTNLDTDLEKGFNTTVQVIGFSQAKNSVEILDITTNIYNSLHRWAMPDTSSYGVSTIHQEFSTIVLEGDGVTRQSIQRFNIIFEPLPA